MTESSDRKRQGSSKGAAGSSASGARKKSSHESIAADNRKKVEDAFDLVEEMEKRHPSEPEKSHQKAKTDNRKAASRSGLRFRFGLDAFISDSDTRAVDNKGVRPGKATLLDFDVTVPYIWKIPIVGKTALRMIKYFQSQDATESVRDILKTLRSKKPF